MNTHNLIGKKKDEAIQMLKDTNTSYRITKEDGESYILTCDFKPFRVNLVLDNGIVTSVSNG